jgi:hypothetical protein
MADLLPVSKIPARKEQNQTKSAQIYHQFLLGIDDTASIGMEL